MKAIEKTTILRRLRNGEHFNTHSGIIRYLKEPIAEFPELTASFTVYEEFFEHESNVFKPLRQMLGTNKVKEADKKRDRAFVAVRMTVKSSLYSIDPEVKAAAASLMLILNDYKRAPQKSYIEASGLINSLTTKLSLRRNRPFVAKLGLTSAVELLCNANKAFVALYGERLDWWRDNKKLGNMKKIRPQVDDAFDRLVYLINSFYAMNEVGEQDTDKREKLTEIIEEINARLDNIKRTTAYRKAGSTPPKAEGEGDSERESGEV
ncbi:DUF6261 family protein [Parabacteroides sp. OttesenSCG-928-G07]|nr:DUF6261 family protein [Parabacteroides sp. OttesenSCG-928-G21]MDL2278459.1 DUF6261 family protein [Parabacteroides sp. OttesenSCG-928-G07]